VTYRIDDEPRPGALAHLVVSPILPLFGVMFGGALVSWPWFILNSLAVGSPTRNREILWAIAGFCGNVALILTIFTVAATDLIGELGIQYALVGLTVWKLLVSYSLYLLQSRSFHLYEHFGGQVRNGIVVVIIASFLTHKLFATLSAFWILVLR
jgi:hypothetical protein